MSGDRQAQSQSDKFNEVSGDLDCDEDKGR